MLVIAVCGIFLLEEGLHGVFDHRLWRCLEVFESLGMKKDLKDLKTISLKQKYVNVVSFNCFFQCYFVITDRNGKVMFSLSSVCPRWG